MIINYLKLGVVATVVVATLYFIHIQREIGKDKALEDVRKENQHAAEQADDHNAKFLECIQSSGLFDFYTGKCARTSSSDWIFSDWFTGKDDPRPKQDR